MSTKLADVRDGATCYRISRRESGRISCSGVGFTCGANCPHVTAYHRAAKRGSHLIVRDAGRVLMVQLVDATPQPPMHVAAYALALQLLPTAPSAALHQAASRIVAYAEQWGAAPRGALAKRAGKTRLIMFDTDG